jgi:hypothetical protein
MTSLISQKIYFFVFIFFWSVLAILNNGMDSSEGLFHYEVALQFWKYGQIGFDTVQDGIFSLAPNGKTYASHEIGNTLFLMPIALVNFIVGNVLSGKLDQEKIYRIQQFLLSFQSGIYTSATLTCFFGILRIRFNKTIINSFISSCLLCFTTYMLTYSRNLFDGVLCSMLLTASFLMFSIYQSNRQHKYIYWGLVCLGFGIITRLSMVIPTMVSFIYLCYIFPGSYRQKLTQLFRNLLVLIPFVSWQLWYNFIRTGIMIKSPVQMPQYYGNNALDGNLITGITGLLISPGKGVFLYAPLLIFSVIFIQKLWKDHPKETIYIVSIFCLWLVLHAKLRSWYGAAGWGPRHLITILPLIYLPVGVYIENIFSNRLYRWSANVLVVFGSFLGISSVISNWHFRLMYASERGVGKNDYFYWSPFDNQVTDMLRAGPENIMRLFTNSPSITIADYSPANIYASNTLNIWANSLIHAGIPKVFVYLIVLLLVAVVVSSFSGIIKLSKKEILSHEKIKEPVIF